MEYYLNEYSIRGQFVNTDDFFASLRNKTIPVLDQVAAEDGSVIIKKDTFWQLEICNGIALYQIPVKRNERSAEVFALKRRLIKLIQEEPHWSANDSAEIVEIEYHFDQGYRDHFEAQNCFTNALAAEGRIISFEHDEYDCAILKVTVKNSNGKYDCELDNITDVSWWDKTPQVKTWYINGYHVEVRAKEFDYHPPHFHVTYGEYNAVYRLADGKLYKSGNRKISPTMVKDVKNLYMCYRDEFIDAWEQLHGKMK